MRGGIDVKKFICLFISLFVVLSSSFLIAAELTGNEILQKIDNVFSANSQDSKIKMIICNEDGQKRERSVQILAQGDNGLVIFLAPADVEGTALLMRKEKDENNMWLYLPALGSVRKVASHMKNGSFMGTDFTYQDFNMVSGEDYADEYIPQLLGSEVIDGDDCYVLDTVPKSDEIDYSHLKMWVRKIDFMILKIEFYDTNGELLKVMTNSQFNKIDGHLVPEVIEMKNVQKNTLTILELSEIKYDVKIPDHFFTTRYLEKN